MLNAKIKEFTDLIVWQEGHKLVILVYLATKNFPKSEQFGLSSQLQRAAVSVTSNVAEGFGRHTYADRARFYYMAQGSLTELKNQLLVAKDIGYLPTEAYTQLKDQADQTHRILQGFIRKTNELIKS